MGLSDLHIHSIYSYDGTASVPAILARAKQIGLDVIAITDHDEINGSLKALELTLHYGIEVIPGIEITTGEGDLLAYNIMEKIQRGLPLIETVLRVRELGGFCIAPHPMAGGFGMQTLIGIETYNATTIDKKSNHYANILSEHLRVAKLGNSDAHVTEAIGLGATQFDGHTATDLLKAIRKQKISIQKKKEWNSLRILGSWSANYVGSAFTRFAGVA